MVPLLAHEGWTGRAGSTSGLILVPGTSSRAAAMARGGLWAETGGQSCTGRAGAPVWQGGHGDGTRVMSWLKWVNAASLSCGWGCADAF